MRGMNVWKIICAVLAVSIYSNAHAALALSATRLILEEKDNQVSVTARNHGKQPIALQSWLEQGEKKPNEIPFVVTPSLARLPANQPQVLRLLYRGQGMPSDKESVLWLNAQEIPQVAKTQNTLQIAIRQRIKVFYRPKGLPGDANDAPTLLTWQLGKQGDQSIVTLNNPSAYHVSLLSVDGIKPYKDMAALMINPGDSTIIPIESLAEHAEPIVHFKTVNDWGAHIPYDVKLKLNSTRSASLSAQ